MAGENSLSIISFNGARLAFPLNEAVGLQRSTVLEQHNEYTVPLSVGSIVHADRRWPVFCLDTDYLPIATLSAAAHHCICLSSDDGETGVALACETVETYNWAEDTAPVALASCMQRSRTPLQQLCLYGERILPVSSTPALAVYLRSLIEDK